jgi:hypothetical protein
MDAIWNSSPLTSVTSVLAAPAQQYGHVQRRLLSTPPQSMTAGTWSMTSSHSSRDASVSNCQENNSESGTTWRKWPMRTSTRSTRCPSAYLRHGIGDGLAQRQLMHW